MKERELSMRIAESRLRRIIRSVIKEQLSEFPGMELKGEIDCLTGRGDLFDNLTNFIKENMSVFDPSNIEWQKVPENRFGTTNEKVLAYTCDIHRDELNLHHFDPGWSPRFTDDGRYESDAPLRKYCFDAKIKKGKDSGNVVFIFTCTKNLKEFDKSNDFIVSAETAKDGKVILKLEKLKQYFSSTL